MKRGAASLVLLVALLTAGVPVDLSAEGLTVYVAKEIVTMDASLPRATAVAVREGRIVEVGSLESMAPWLERHAHAIDESFERKVLLPGFVDNHLHPIMAAVLLPMEFTTPYGWSLPGRRVQGVIGREAYLARLRELEAAADEDAPLFAWGYHPLFHGELSRADLDVISEARPIVAWHRSFHEIIVNTRALEWMEIDAEKVAGHPTIDLETGHFAETGLLPAFQALTPHLLAPERIARGLSMMREAVHAGGLTTIADMATGLFDLDMEWKAMQGILENEQTPFRSVLVPDARALSARLGPDAAFELIDSLPARSTPHLRFDRAVKLFADGAFFSQLMQLGPPGYIDGHHGEWLMKPGELAETARRYWEAGYQIHVHANGDLGVGTTLDVLQGLLDAQPRFDHRFTLHHYGFSTSAQARRVSALGALVSANVYYLYSLAPKYSELGLGVERASQIVRAGTLVRNGVPVSFHSDLTMAPAEPLLFAWIAANRVASDGSVYGPTERLSVEQALRAVTLDAAHAIRLDHEIGSIVAGKRADFTVLDRNPLRVSEDELREIQVEATVFEGRPFPVEIRR